MLDVIESRKRNWLGHYRIRRCLLSDAEEGTVHGKDVREQRMFQLIDGIKDKEKYDETKRVTQNRVQWRAALTIPG